MLVSELTERFGSLPAAVAERVTRASLPDLERWGKGILEAASLDEVFAPDAPDAW